MAADRFHSHALCLNISQAILVLVLMMRPYMARSLSIEQMARHIATVSFFVLIAAGVARAETPLSSSAIAGSSIDAGLPLADTVVVRKAQRTLQLLRDGQVL